MYVGTYAGIGGTLLVTLEGVGSAELLGLLHTSEIFICFLGGTDLAISSASEGGGTSTQTSSVLLSSACGVTVAFSGNMCVVGFTAPLALLPGILILILTLGASGAILEGCFASCSLRGGRGVSCSIRGCRGVSCSLRGGREAPCSLLIPRELSCSNFVCLAASWSDRSPRGNSASLHGAHWCGNTMAF